MAMKKTIHFLNFDAINKIAIMLNFYTRKPCAFSHKPIYWDPKKEEMDERKKRIETEGLSSCEDIETRKKQLRGKFIQTSTHLNKRRKNAASTFSFAKIFSLIVLLIAIIYFFYFANWIHRSKKELTELARLVDNLQKIHYFCAH